MEVFGVAVFVFEPSKAKQTVVAVFVFERSKANSAFFCVVRVQYNSAKGLQEKERHFFLSFGGPASQRNERNQWKLSIVP